MIGINLIDAEKATEQSRNASSFWYKYPLLAKNTHTVRTSMLMTYPPGSFIERDMIAHSVCKKCSLLEICFLKTVFKKVAPDMDNCRIKLGLERYTWLRINLLFKSKSFFWQCALCTLSECVCWVHTFRAFISKLFSSPRIDSKESILLAYEAWRADTTTLYQLGS